MARRKVKPTQQTRGKGRQGTRPKGRAQQAGRKRGARAATPERRRRTKNRGRVLRSPRSDDGRAPRRGRAP